MRNRCYFILRHLLEGRPRHSHIKRRGRIVYCEGHSMENEVTIRIGGESGEGTISGGDILALAASRWGYHVSTFRTFPAEILGGPCLFQVRISDQPVKSMGDYADVLICLNQEAYDRNISDLRHGGVLIYDPSDFTPEASDHIP